MVQGLGLGCRVWGAGLGVCGIPFEESSYLHVPKGRAETLHLHTGALYRKTSKHSPAEAPRR